jgi:hypothetical protein
LYNSKNKLKFDAVSNSTARGSTSPITEKKKNLSAATGCITAKEVLLSDS